MFSFEYCEIFKNNYFEERNQTVASTINKSYATVSCQILLHARFLYLWKRRKTFQGDIEKNQWYEMS